MTRAGTCLHFLFFPTLISWYVADMIAETTSIHEQKETESCVCCGGNSAVRVSRDEQSIRGGIPTREDLDVDLEFIECHVCGYAWYEMDIARPEAPPVVNVVHDVSIGLPGQPSSGPISGNMPSFLLTAKPASDVRTDRIGDATNWVQHYFYPLAQNLQRKPISEQVFHDEISSRMAGRRAVALQ